MHETVQVLYEGHPNRYIYNHFPDSGGGIG